MAVQLEQMIHYWLGFVGCQFPQKSWKFDNCPASQYAVYLDEEAKIYLCPFFLRLHACSASPLLVDDFLIPPLQCFQLLAALLCIELKAADHQLAHDLLEHVIVPSYEMSKRASTSLSDQV